MKIKVLGSEGQIANFEDKNINFQCADVEVDNTPYINKPLIAKEDYKELLWYQYVAIISLVSLTCSKIDGIIGLMAIGVGLIANATIFYRVVQKRQYLQKKYNL
jgi:hypothetical protein